MTEHYNDPAGFIYAGPGQYLLDGKVRTFKPAHQIETPAHRLAFVSLSREDGKDVTITTDGSCDGPIIAVVDARRLWRRIVFPMKWTRAYRHAVKVGLGASFTSTQALAVNEEWSMPSRREPWSKQ